MSNIARALNVYFFPFYSHKIQFMSKKYEAYIDKRVGTWPVKFNNYNAMQF